MVSFNDAVSMVKSRLNIVDFFEGRGIKVKRSGTRYWALCPFHDEDTPSFSIDENTNRYYCFGCGERGDMFDYMAKVEGLDFRDALDEECTELGIQIDVDDDSADEARKRKVYMSILKDTWGWFRARYDELDYNHIVKRHEIRMKRSISSDARDNHDLFGWAPEGAHKLEAFLKSRGYAVDDMVAAGVLSRSDDGRVYCPWSARLMFPICDMLGRPVGFSGRVVYDDEGDAGKPKRKYVNSRDNEIYHKSDVLFCQSIAKTTAAKRKSVYVVEGQFDVIAMQNAGYDNTVASSGTALSQQQARTLQRMVGEGGRIIYTFDADEAGQKAAVRAFMNTGSLQSQSYAVVTGTKDPSDLLAQDGALELRRQVGMLKPLWEHVMHVLKSHYDVTTSEGAHSFILEFKSVYETTIDPIIADRMVELAALWTGSSVNAIRVSLNLQPKAEPESKKYVTESLTSTVDGKGMQFNLTPEMALNAAVLDYPALRFVLEYVPMTGIDGKFREWLLNATNDGSLESGYDLDSSERFVPAHTVVTPDSMKSETGRAYAEALYRVIDHLHRFDLVASTHLNSSSLVAQQLRVIVEERRKESMRVFLAELQNYVPHTADADLLMAYEERLRSGVGKINDDADEFLHALAPVFKSIERESERFTKEDVDRLNAEALENSEERESQAKIEEQVQERINSTPKAVKNSLKKFDYAPVVPRNDDSGNIDTGMLENTESVPTTSAPVSKSSSGDSDTTVSALDEYYAQMYDDEGHSRDNYWEEFESMSYPRDDS